MSTVIIIAGPTAVGKTGVAVQLSKHFNTEIISADSRQCYKELNIGVARPSVQELQEIPHHFIASHSIHEEVTAAAFEQYALQKANELFTKHKVVVMVGGTGLYIKAFCEGLDVIPAIDAGIRENIMQQYEANGLAWLQQQVQQKDPVYFLQGETQNPQRMMRALEVVEGTGQSITHFQKGQKATRDFNIIKLGLELPREELTNRINARVDVMMQQDLIDEVKSLTAFKNTNALQTVGYAEIFDHLDGKLSIDKAVEEIKIHTRQYAKRQMTWFKRDSNYKWVNPSEIEKIIVHLKVVS